MGFLFVQNKFVHDPIVFLGDGTNYDFLMEYNYDSMHKFENIFYIKNSETHNTMKLRT